MERGRQSRTLGWLLILIVQISIDGHSQAADIGEMRLQVDEATTTRERPDATTNYTTLGSNDQIFLEESTTTPYSSTITSTPTTFNISTNTNDKIPEDARQKFWLQSEESSSPQPATDPAKETEKDTDTSSVSDSSKTRENQTFTQDEGLDELPDKEKSPMASNSMSHAFGVIDTSRIASTITPASSSDIDNASIKSISLHGFSHEGNHLPSTQVVADVTEELNTFQSTTFPVNDLELDLSATNDETEGDEKSQIRDPVVVTRNDVTMETVNVDLPLNNVTVSVNISLDDITTKDTAVLDLTYSNITTTTTDDVDGATGSVGRFSPNKTQLMPQSYLEFVERFRFGTLVSTLFIDVTGFVLNSFTLAVFWRMPVSTSNTYMMLLTAFDNMFLFANIPPSALHILLKRYESWPREYAYFRLYFELPVQMGTRNTVSFIAGIMAMDRLLTIAFPLRSLGKSPLQQPKIVGLVTALLVYGYNFFELAIRLQVSETFNPATNSTIVIIGNTALYLDNVVYFNLLFVIANSLMRYLPPLILVVANVGLVVSLWRYSRSKHLNDVPSASSANPRRSSSLRSAKVVLVYSVAYFLLSLPFLLATITVTAVNDLPWKQPLLFSLLPVILPLMDSLNSSINFFVYVTANSIFRRGFKVVICRRR